MTHNALALAAVFALVLVTALTLAYLLLLRLPLSRERGSRGRTSRPERIVQWNGFTMTTGLPADTGLLVFS